MKTRYRLRRRFLRTPLVVLQVEDTRFVNSDPPCIEGFYAPYWRDATAEDFMNEVNEEGIDT